MSSTIVVATDLSEYAVPAARWAGRFAEATDCEVVVVNVTEINFSNWASGAYDLLEDQQLHAKAEQRVRRWYRDATDQQPDAVEVRVGTAEVQIEEAVDEREADYLVMGRSGKNALEKFWVGSTARSMAQDPPTRLVVAHPEHVDPELDTIAVGTDFSANADAAVETACELAATLEATLEIVHASEEPKLGAVDPEELPGDYQPDDPAIKADEAMSELLERHREALAGVSYADHLIDANPAGGLIEFVESRDIEMVVVGRAGESEFVAAILGSVLSKVLHHIDATVVVAPARAAS